VPPILGTWGALPASAELAPIDVLVAELGMAAIRGMVPDADGTVWATRGDVLLNIVPETGSVRAWTLADDPLTATASIAPSTSGGVWLINEQAIRRFAYDRFVTVIETPSRVLDMAEGAGGTIWAITAGHGLAYWNGGVWSAPPGRGPSMAASLLIDREGRAWTADVHAGSLGQDRFVGVTMWDGVGWTHFAPEELGFDPLTAPTLLEGGDGSIWATHRFRHARFTGHDWETVQLAVTGLAEVSLKAVDAEGRLWVIAADCQGCDGVVRVYHGSNWTTFPDERGAPGPAPGVSVERGGDRGGASILIAGDTVFAATPAGLARLADRTWRLVPLATAAGPLSPRGPVAAMAAASSTEVWVATAEGLYRFDGESWRHEQVPGANAVLTLAAGPGRTVWAGTSAGPMVQTDGSWAELGDLVGESIPSAFRGPSCKGPAIHLDRDGTAYYLGPRSAGRVVAIRNAGESWVATPVTGAFTGPCGPATVAVTGTSGGSGPGAIWALTPDHTVVRWDPDGPAWEIGAPGAPGESCPASAVSAIAVDHGGRLWAAVAGCAEPGLSQGVFEFLGDNWVQRPPDPSVGTIAQLAFLASGELVSVGDGLAIYPDPYYADRRLRGLPLEHVSIGLDGSVWVAGANVYRLPRPLDALPP
jgi:hypothetical protein